MPLPFEERVALPLMVSKKPIVMGPVPVLISKDSV